MCQYARCVTLITIMAVTHAVCATPITKSQKHLGTHGNMKSATNVTCGAYAVEHISH